MRLAEVLVGLTRYGRGRITVVVGVNGLFLGWIEHHVDHILDVLEALVFEVEHDISNKLLLCPDEEDAVLHDFGRDNELFEVLDGCTTEGLATFISTLSFLLLLSTASENLFAMIGPLWVQKNTLNLFDFDILALVVFIVPLKLCHIRRFVDFRE